MEILIYGVIVLILAALILSGKFRVLVRGFFGLFVQNIAKTPEGAEAVYNQVIEKAQNDYNTANDALQRIAGQLDTAQKTVASVKDAIKAAEAKCEQFAKANQFEKVEIFANERNDLFDDLEIHETAVKELTPLFEEAKLLNNTLEAKLAKLKKEKTQTISKMKLNTQLKDMYDGMNELKNTTNADKLLDAVKEGAKEKRELAVGAGVVHNNKLSTKIDKANAEAKTLTSNSYVDELKKKYGK